ncbi:MAG TPA: hypothetical protein VGL46_14230 [Pseudonocardiaceae bacterium]|jgi:hypothetical protein
MSDPAETGDKPDDRMKAVSDAADRLRQVVDAGAVPPKWAAQLAALLDKLASRVEPPAE